MIRLDGLGDMVLTTPLFRELKRAFPRSSCTVVVQDGFRPLLVTNPYIDEIIGLRTVPIGWLPPRIRTLLSMWSLYWDRLRGRHFDFAISPRWDVDDQLATFLCSVVDAKNRVGYTEMCSPSKQHHNRGFDAAFNKCLSRGPLQHEVLRNLDIVKAMGGKIADSRLEINLTQRDRDFASQLLATVPTSTTVLAIGIGGRSPGRRWPLQNYAETLKRLAEERRVQPVIICSREESEEARKLGKLLPREPILVSGIPLRKVCGVVERCALFIGNDNGSAHLAGAMNCRVIVISRHPKNGDLNHANSPLRFAPYCDHVRVLQPAAGLDDCSAACLSLIPHCIRAVGVDQVVAAAREMLRSEPRSFAGVHPTMGPPHSDLSRLRVDSAAAGAVKKLAAVYKVGSDTFPRPT
jgi:heptosyltransferase-2